MLQINDLSKSYADRVLFEDVTFSITKGSRIGLVGRNGTGKSTLFKIINNEVSPDTGSITIPKNYKIGTLNQHLKFTENTLSEECYQVLKGENTYNTFLVDKILFGLGFSAEDLSKSPTSFSGGYQIRINLAKLLATAPDLLLLDEPTNYLDIVSMRWLQNFLRQFPGEVILITHDQEFMDSVVTHTMGIHRKKLRIIEGNTEKFYSQILLDEENYEKTRLNFEKRKKEIEQFVEKFRAKASKASQAQSKLKQLQKLESLDKLDDENDLEFNFQYKEIASKNFLEVKQLSFGYKENEKLFNDVSFQLKKGDCLAIIGKNGKGKSTLLNCVANELKAIGEIKYHPDLKIGHFGQTNINRLNNQLTIIDEIQSVSNNLTNTQIRNICATMMFTNELAEKKVSVLSGGERSRVMLGKIIASANNLLLLDEPTNHLDMQSIESLCEAIENFPGASIIVTHSESIIKRLANKLIIFKNGTAEFFEGQYDEFLTKIGWDDEELKSKDEKLKNKLNKKEIQKIRSDIILERSKLTKPLKNRIDQLETSIDNNDQLLKKLNDELIAASNKSDGNLISELSKKVSTLEDQIENEFEELSEIQNNYDLLMQEFEDKLNLLLE